MLLTRLGWTNRETPSPEIGTHGGAEATAADRQDTVAERKRSAIRRAVRPAAAGYLALLLPSLIAALAILRFSDQVGSLGQLGYVGAFALALIGNAVVAVPFPWSLPIGAMANVYSTAGIVAVAAVGATCGSMIPYLLGGRLGRRTGSAKITTWLVALPGPLKFGVLAALAFSPVMSYPTLAAGMLRYPAWATFAVTLIAEGAKIWLLAAGFRLVYHLNVP